ncbi:hypothetical protein PBCV1_a086L [Paramecium bursaria Chlorella virus 1]|uniref:Uncharacterized protein n=1 Tax=Paramecium bursaria Chlorella virus 1 TaxID=10506 RepID=Q84407_PBCV1|nr:hypothetical protein PBCV1_a086L [Paramecium bursaria Chlorella virus 1]AAC96454.1 hypothetical protein [Paramecium bursaria Chlorella virus 1]
MIFSPLFTGSPACKVSLYNFLVTGSATQKKIEVPFFGFIFVLSVGKSVSPPPPSSGALRYTINVANLWSFGHASSQSSPS